MLFTLLKDKNFSTVIVFKNSIFHYIMLITVSVYVHLVEQPRFLSVDRF